MATVILILFAFVCLVAVIKMLYVITVGIGKALWKWAPFLVLVGFGLLYFWAVDNRQIEIQTTITRMEQKYDR